MKIFEVVKPGNSLVNGDVRWQLAIQRLLSNLESEFYDANLALNLFESIPSSIDREFYKQRMMRDREHFAGVVERMEAVFSVSDATNDIYSAARLQAKRETWVRENGSRLLEFRKRFLFAKTFVYALDSFEKTLKVLSQEPGVSKKLNELCLYMNQAFPDLRGVRDTSHHMEDRVRGLNRKKKPLNVKPVNVISPNGGVMILNSLIGSVYGTTMDDGGFGGVDVSEESMKVIQRVLQETLNSFEWWGWPVHLPHE